MLVFSCLLRLSKLMCNSFSNPKEILTKVSAFDGAVVEGDA